MPEVTARTTVGAAIQAAKQAVQADQNRQQDVGVVTAPQPEATPAPTDDSQRHAAFARREKLFREAQRKFLAEKQAWETQRGQTQPVDPKVEREKLLSELRDRAANDPLAVVTELGMELQSLRAEQTNAQKLLESQKQASLDQEKKQLRSQAMFLMNTTPDFKVLSALGSVLNEPVDEAVAEYVQQSIESGNEVSVHEAAKAIQDFMIENSMSAAELPEIKQRLVEKWFPKQPEPKPEAQQSQPTTPRVSTLTQDVGPSRPLSPKDKRQRAIWAAQGLDPNTGKPFA